MSFIDGNYVIIDFETANSSSTSICQIGMVKVRDHKIIDTYNKLVKPTPSYFSSFNIAVHGIKSSDVTNSPSFIKTWPEIQKFIEGYQLVAHFAQFDMKCLTSILNLSKQDYNIDFICSCRIAQELIDSKSHSLTYLSQNITNYQYKAHDALEDCLATYELLNYCFNKFDVQKLVSAKFNLGNINNNTIYTGFKYKRSSNTK